MMRSYAFTLIFITSRIPDAFVSSYSDQILSDMLWSLVVLGLVAPDVIMTGQTFWRLRYKVRPSKGSSLAFSEDPIAI